MCARRQEHAGQAIGSFIRVPRKLCAVVVREKRDTVARDFTPANGRSDRASAALPEHTAKPLHGDMLPATASFGPDNV